MRLKQGITSVLAIFVFLVVPALAKLGPTKLEELIKGADFIVTGKVVKVHQAGRIKLAEVEIDKTYKGNTTLKNIFYLATPTWTCDTSGANEGETSLLLLKTMSDWRTLSIISEQSAVVRKQLSSLIGGRPFFGITVSGLGRMPFTYALSKQDQFVVSEEVIFPDTFKVIRRKKPNSFDWDYDRLVHFSAIRSFIQQTRTKSQNTKISTSSLTRNSQR